MGATASRSCRVMLELPIEEDMRRWFEQPHMIPNFHEVRAATADANAVSRRWPV
jgi:hypothetical protein